jgi:hypothetical protein
MQGVNHETIELRAYELWEQEGRPFGRSEEFWFRASTELAINGGAVKKSKKAAAPKAKAATSTKTKAVAEPAAKPKKTTATKTAAKKKH